MARRITGQPQSPRRPHPFPIGQLSTKSSVYSPVSMSRASQEAVHNHMKAHYQRILSAKACVDTSAPKSMKLTIKEQDRKRKEALLSTSLQSRESAPKGQELNNNSTINDPSSYTSRQENERASDAPRSERFMERGYYDYPSDQQRLRKKGNEDSRITDNSLRHTIDDYRHFQRTKPVQKASMENFRARENKEISKLSDIPHTAGSYSSHRGKERSSEMDDFDKFSERFYTSTPLYERKEGFEVIPSLLTFSYKSPPIRRRQRKKTTELIWTEEQKYLQFISDVTSDVLARGICSNRVINTVFESHIEKRKDDLNEENMRDMIEQLKEDLGITDD